MPVISLRKIVPVFAGTVVEERRFRQQCRVVSVIAGYNNAFQLPPPSPVDVVNIGQTAV
jgi:hypothetical protein